MVILELNSVWSLSRTRRSHKGAIRHDSDLQAMAPSSSETRLSTWRSSAGKFAQFSLPRRLHLDAEHARAAGADCVLMRHARGAEGKGEWPELDIASAIFLFVITAEEEAEEWQFVRMRRQLAGRGVMQVGEDGTAGRRFA